MTLSQYIKTDFSHFTGRLQNDWHVSFTITPSEMTVEFMKDGSSDVYPAAVVQLHGRKEVLKAIAIAKEVRA